MWGVRIGRTLPIFPFRNVPIELIAWRISLLLEVAVVIDHRIESIVRAWLGDLEVELIDYLLLFLSLLFQPVGLGLQVFLAETVGAASCQFAHVLQSIHSAAEHRGVDAGLGKCDFLSFVDEVEASDDLLVSLQPR